MAEQSTTNVDNRVVLDKLAFHNYVDARLTRDHILNAAEAHREVKLAISETCLEMGLPEQADPFVYDHVSHWCATTSFLGEDVEFSFGRTPDHYRSSSGMQKFLLSVIGAAISPDGNTFQYFKSGYFSQGYKTAIDRIDGILGTCKRCRESIELSDVVLEPNGTHNFVFRVILDFDSDYNHISIVVPWVS